jgi:Membrane bound O-acyl transferase family
VKEATLSEIVPEQSVAEPRGDQSRSWIGKVPLVLLPMMAMMLRAKLLPWAFMWLLAVAIFAGCKWQTWWEARATERGAGNWKRSAAYLLLWPGMEAREFFAVAGEKRSIPTNAWLSGVAKTLAGIVLTWAGARMLALGHPLAGGWAGMVGLVLVLHFGTFHLIALAWQSAGLRVKPIMQRPLASRSLSELWGKRWNLGFRKLTHTWVFQPLSKRFGPVAGILGAFLASGLLHDFVISAPAGAGYGLPTVYFLVQGLGVIAERSETGKRVGLGRGVRGWLWTALIAAGPLYWLFHPWFVMRVMVPFLRAVVG